MVRTLLAWMVMWCLPLSIPAYDYVLSFVPEEGLPVMGLHRVAGWLLTSVVGIIAVADWGRLNRHFEKREVRRLIFFFHVLAAVITMTLTYVGIRLADLIIIWNAKPGGLVMNASSQADVWWQAARGIGWWIIPAAAIPIMFHRLGSAMGKKSGEIK